MSRFCAFCSGHCVLVGVAHGLLRRSWGIAAYRTRAAFVAGTFDELGKVLPEGAQLRVEHLIVTDDQAVVELSSDATAENGMRFDNRYCWVVCFRGDVIVRVRAYLDSAKVTQLFEENSIT
jgi:uncharacterized protein